MAQGNSFGEGLKAESRKVVSELETLRDEIRLKLHLASADGRDVWNQLEPQLEQWQHRVDEAADEAMGELRSAGAELKTNLERLCQSLRKS